MNRFRTFLKRHERAHSIWVRLLVWLGHRRIPFLRPRLQSERGFWKMVECRDRAKPGDIICVRSRVFLTSYLIPGRYKHTAVYTGHGFIVHAVSPQVCEEKLENFLSAYDGFILLRPKPPYDWKAADRAVFTSIGKRYDFLFSDGDDVIYCHELGAAKAIQAGSGRQVPKVNDYYTFEDILAVCDVVMEA